MSFTVPLKKEKIGRFLTLMLQYLAMGVGFVSVVNAINAGYVDEPVQVLLEQSVYLEKIAMCLPLFLLLVTDFRKFPSVWQEHKKAFLQIETGIGMFGRKCLSPLYKIWLRIVTFFKGRDAEILAFFGTTVVSFLIVETFCMNTIWNIMPIHIVENLVLYGGIYFMIWVLVRNCRVVSIVDIAFFTLVGIVNYFTINFRGNPVSLGDLTVINTALSVAGGFKYTVNANFVAATCLAVVAIVLLCIVKIEKRPVKKTAYWIQFTVTYACIIVLIVIAIQSGFLYNRIDTETWNPKLQTEKNGYLLSFVADSLQVKVAKPDEYVPSELITELSETEETIMMYNGEEGVYPNIIVVMNESFCDLNVLGEVDTDVEVMPYFKSMTDGTIYGDMYVSAFGGNTVYTEFEFLTCNSMAFLPSGSIPYIQYMRREVNPSLAWTLKQQEVPYEAIAIHPFDKSGYNRTVVYNSFGFDDFITDDEFEDCTIYRKYISDEDDYKKVFEVFEEKEEGQPIFIFNVTMQNHGGYGERTDYVFREPVHVTNLTVEPGVDEYLSMVKESDTAFEMLIDYFTDVEEPTIILFFGDHQPQLGGTFYNTIFEKDANYLNQDEIMSKHQVPFVIWSNYQDLGGIYVDKISPNYLSTLLLEIAGIERTDYQKYLSNVYQEYPVITCVGAYNADGGLINVDDEKLESEQLGIYERIQYNYMFEEEERMDDYFYPR